LLAAAGFELRSELAPADTGRSHILDDVPRILKLTPEQRLIELRNAARLVAGARPVRPDEPVPTERKRRADGLTRNGQPVVRAGRSREPLSARRR
jgi:hypothetical protein